MGAEIKKTKFGNIKKIAFNLILSIVIFLVVYTLTAFVLWDFNCKNWGDLGRYSVILITVVANLIAHTHLKDKIKDKI